MKCIIHKWGYETVDEMSMTFRVCEDCGALEGKSILYNGMRDHWHKYAPRDGRGFIDALRQKILHDKIANEAKMNSEAIDIESSDVEDAVNG